METPQYQDDVKVIPEFLQADQPINWKKYFFLFLTNWYWFLISVFLAISILYFKTRYTLPIYQASATILIEEDDGSGDIISEIRSVKRMRRKTDMSNEIAKLSAYSLHKRTVDSLGWDIFWTAYGRVAMKRPLYKSPPYKIETDSLSNPWYINSSFNISALDGSQLRFQDEEFVDTIIPLDTWVNIRGWKFRISRTRHRATYASYGFTIYDPNTIATRYRAKTRLEITADEGTIIRISAEGPIAQQEIDYINTLSENYINTGLERKRLIGTNTLRFVEEQIQIIQDSLNKTEQKLVSFRLNNSMVDIDQEGQQAYEKLKEFYTQKTEIQLKKNYYEYLKGYIGSKLDPQAVITPVLVDANDQMLINQVQNLQKLYEERETLAFSASEDNPGLVQINQRIQFSRTRIIEIIEGLIYNNNLSWEQIDIEEQQIKKQLLQLPVSEQELLNIQRKYEVNNEFYTFLLEKRAEAGIQRASTVSNVRILDRGLPYTVIITGPKQTTIFFIALVIGLIVPLGIIFLVDYLDNRIKDHNDVEASTNLPIIGVVSHDATDEVIPVYAQPGSAFTETFRHIRTNLTYYLREPHQKVIMVSSTISGEGKTFIATNLAAILAMNNKKILLAGFDLRRPSLHKQFQLDNTKGISTFLAGQHKLNTTIQPSDIEGLDILVAGPVPPNPAELLETNLLGELIKEVSDRYDYVIIDTSPIALVTDALLISKYSDVNIIIIRQNYTPKGVFEMVNKLQEKNMATLSLLINDIRESKAFGYRYYYGYGYGYNYPYKYGNRYYQDES